MISRREIVSELLAHYRRRLILCYVKKKVDAVKELMGDTRTDILCLTETWPEDSDAVCIKHVHQVLERARIVCPKN